MKTVTDSKGFKSRVINRERHAKLDTDLKKIMFESLKNGMLEIFPVEKNAYPDLTIEYAENFAFIVTEKFEPALSGYIQEEIKKALAAATAQAGGVSTTTK